MSAFFIQATQVFPILALIYGIFLDLKQYQYESIAIFLLTLGYEASTKRNEYNIVSNGTFGLCFPNVRTVVTVFGESSPSLFSVMFGIVLFVLFVGTMTDVSLEQ